MAKRIRCNECLQEIEEDDAVKAVDWIFEHSCKRPKTVFVVLTDLGAGPVVDSVHAHKPRAVERAKEARCRKLLPALSTDVIEELVR